jgi:hypothetical protein
MTAASAHSLDALHLGFRARYLRYDELTRQLEAWAEAFPEVATLSSLGTTPEGRSLWMLTIGRDPGRIRPAAWVDGNMHASEVAGSSVALAIAEDLLRAHVEPDAAPHGLPPHLLALLRDDVLFYVLPRICPDGAEQILTTGHWVRSNPRDTRLGRSGPSWKLGDVDGDGTVMLLRREDPAGDYVVSETHPNLMLPRRVEDPGPYYRIYPEGLIERFDGVSIPDPSYLSDNETDLNRNFPYQWAPEPRELGAGPHPMSEPESQAVVAFAARHPNIFVWMNLHTYGGVYIRPPGDKADRTMDRADFEVYRQLEEWGERFAGYPTVGGFEEFTYEPDKPLCGDLAEYAWGQRGAVGFVCELWDFFKQAGLPVLRPFVWNYQRRTREEGDAIATWDRDHNAGRILQPWRPFEHPQLGPVEVGGYDPRVGLWNPPYEALAGVCTAQSQLLLRLAALAPRVRFVDVEVASLGEGLARISAVLENVGYLPTYVLASAKTLPWNDPLHAWLTLGAGVRQVSGDERIEVGHLGGWGGHHKSPMPSHPGTWSTGGTTRRRVSWVVAGEGEVTLRAGAARVGEVAVTVAIG